MTKKNAEDMFLKLGYKSFNLNEYTLAYMHNCDGKMIKFDKKNKKLSFEYFKEDLNITDEHFHINDYDNLIFGIDIDYRLIKAILKQLKELKWRL